MAEQTHSPAPPHPTFGDKLRQAREARGIDLRAIADSTKIGEEKLRALESNRFEELPGGVFNRGFVRAVAECIGADAGDLVAAYEDEERAQARRREDTPPDENLEAYLNAIPPAEPGSPDSSRSRRIGIVAAVIVLALAGAALGVRMLGSGESAKIAPRPPDAAASEEPSRRPEPSRLGASSQEIPNPEPGNPTPSSPEPGKAEASPPESSSQEASPPEASKNAARGDVDAATPEAARPRAADSATSAPAAGASVPSSDEPAIAPSRAAVEVEPPAPEPTAPPKTSAAEPQAVTTPRPLVTAPAASGLSVSSAGVGADVVNHELREERTTFEEGERVYFWTRVEGGSPGQTVRHVWMREGALVSVIDIELGGGNFRAHSFQTMRRGAAGRWVVEARDAADTVLARREFVCMKGSGAQARINPPSATPSP